MCCNEPTMVPEDTTEIIWPPSSLLIEYMMNVINCGYYIINLNVAMIRFIYL